MELMYKIAFLIVVLIHLGHCFSGTTEKMNKDKPRKRRRTGFQDVEEEDFNFTVEAVVDGKVERFDIASTDQTSGIAGLGIDFPEPINDEAFHYHFEDVHVQNTGTNYIT